MLDSSIKENDNKWNDMVGALKNQLNQEKKKSQKMIVQRSNLITEKNELEMLFLECVDETRKEILRRRQSQTQSKKKTSDDKVG